MAAGEPSTSRSRLLRIAAALAAIATVAGALKLGGAFDDEEKPVDPAPLAAPYGPKPQPQPAAETTTIEVGGQPAAIAADDESVVVADGASPAATKLDAVRPRPAAIPLDDPASAVAVADGDAWLGLVGIRGVERRSMADPQMGETIELDAIPSAIVADAGGAWVLTESAIERVEPGADEAVESLGAGGFATAMDVAGDAIWVVADNRAIRRFDAESLEAADTVAEVPDAIAIAIGEGYAWVLTSTGELTRLDLDTMRRVGEPTRVEGALALAVGEGAVWVTARDGTVTRIDPASAQAVGGPVPAGEEPIAIAAGGGAIWVAGAGDGTVTRIAP